MLIALLSNHREMGSALFYSIQFTALPHFLFWFSSVQQTVPAFKSREENGLLYLPTSDSGFGGHLVRHACPHKGVPLTPWKTADDTHMYSRLLLIRPSRDWGNWSNYLADRIKQDVEKRPEHTTDSFGSICPILTWNEMRANFVCPKYKHRNDIKAPKRKTKSSVHLIF